MNRGFAFYFRNAIKSSATAIWKNKSILSVMVYYLAEIVAKMTIIFSAVFALADVRQAKIVDGYKRFDIAQTFKVATKPKPVWTIVLSIIAEAFIFLGGALIIAAITCVLALIGYAVCWLAQGPVFIIALFCIPGGLLFFVYALLMCLIFSPTAYIIETNPDIGVHETLKICFDTMRGRGKFTACLNCFIPALIKSFILGVCIFVGRLLAVFVTGPYMPVILVVWYIFSLAVILLVFPMFDLTQKIAQKSLFADIVSDPVNANKRTSGINIKMCKGVKFKPTEVRENLAALFDETESDSVPEPDSPARKKVNKKAEKAAKNKKDNKEVNEEVKEADIAEPQPEQPAPEQPAEPQPEQPAPEQPAEHQPEQPAPEQPVEPQPEQSAND